MLKKKEKKEVMNQEKENQRGIETEFNNDTSVHLKPRQLKKINKVVRNSFILSKIVIVKKIFLKMMKIRNFLLCQIVKLKVTGILLLECKFKID